MEQPRVNKKPIRRDRKIVTALRFTDARSRVVGMIVAPDFTAKPGGDNPGAVRAVARFVIPARKNPFVARKPFKAPFIGIPGSCNSTCLSQLFFLLTTVKCVNHLLTGPSSLPPSIRLSCAYVYQYFSRAFLMAFRFPSRPAPVRNPSRFSFPAATYRLSSCRAALALVLVFLTLLSPVPARAALELYGGGEHLANSGDFRRSPPAARLLFSAIWPTTQRLPRQPCSLQSIESQFQQRAQGNFSFVGHLVEPFDGFGRGFDVELPDTASRINAAFATRLSLPRGLTAREIVFLGHSRDRFFRDRLLLFSA